MRRRITQTFVAVAAAGITTGTLGFTAAGAANAATSHATQAATTGTTISTTNQAGYQASGRDFRYISSTLSVPDATLATLTGALYPREYVQLSNGTQLHTKPVAGTGNAYARAGIESCAVAKKVTPALTCTATWTAFVEIFNNTLATPTTTHYIPLAVSSGDGVGFSIYYNQGGNSLSFVITPPNANGSTGPTTYIVPEAGGPIYDHAAALDDFTNSVGGVPIVLPPFINPFRINHFLAGALTTYSGDRGSFVGPWTTSRVVATSNGLSAPSGTVRVSPGALWSDGMSANGAVRPFDAFTVWAR